MGEAGSAKVVCNRQGGGGGIQDNMFGASTGPIGDRVMMNGNCKTVGVGGWGLGGGG